MTIYSVDGDVRLTLAPDPGYFCIFYVLIPFMMIFSCVEYPILVFRAEVGWWCTVDCFSRLSEPFVFSLFVLYHTLRYRFLDASFTTRSDETI